MGEPRFQTLEAMLPEDVHVLGVDEHTACIMDLGRNEARIRGLGGAVLRRGGSALCLDRNAVVSLDVLKGNWRAQSPQPTPAAPEAPDAASGPPRSDSFWESIHALEERFQTAQDAHDAESMSAVLLELDRFIWTSSRNMESEEFISQARELLREWVVMLGASLSARPRTTDECLGPLVEELLRLRDDLRRRKRWEEADALRDCLQRARVIIEDTGAGSRWRIG
jgi:hypothetical protein